MQHPYPAAPQPARPVVFTWLLLACLAGHLRAQAPAPTDSNPAHSAATLMGALPGTQVTVYDALGRLVTSALANATGTGARGRRRAQPLPVG